MDHKLDRVKTIDLARNTGIFNKAKEILAKWDDAAIGREAAHAIEDLGVVDAIQWYGGFTGTTTQLGEWVRHFLFETPRGHLEQTIPTEYAAQFLLLSDNVAIASEPRLAAIIICRLAAVKALQSRSLAYWKLATKIEPETT